MSYGPPKPTPPPAEPWRDGRTFYTCPKCRNRAAVMADSCFGFDVEHVTLAGDELLQVTCRRCHYIGFELPEDARHRPMPTPARRPIKMYGPAEPSASMRWNIGHIIGAALIGAGAGAAIVNALVRLRVIG